ncbi:MAG: hypothetical protein K2K25_07775 [Muribaculaceae bacterium]|nr:hypothetical protein [Muribaculaceae bacterium]
MKFVIVYENFTKPAAVSLSNQLSNKFECTLWDKKHYFANEAGLNNKNRIILLNEDLINENLANPSLLAYQIVPGMDYKREGNMIGVVYNETTSPKKLSDILKENWGKYAAGIIGPLALLGGLPGAAIIAWLLTISQKKKIKFKLYMDAVNVLAKSKLQDILNG